MSDNSQILLSQLTTEQPHEADAIRFNLQRKKPKFNDVRSRRAKRDSQTDGGYVDAWIGGWMDKWTDR